MATANNVTSIKSSKPSDILQAFICSELLHYRPCPNRNMTTATTSHLPLGWPSLWSLSPRRFSCFTRRCLCVLLYTITPQFYPSSSLIRYDTALASISRSGYFPYNLNNCCLLWLDALTMTKTILKYSRYFKIRDRLRPVEHTYPLTFERPNDLRSTDDLQSTKLIINQPAAEYFRITLHVEGSPGPLESAKSGSYRYKWL